MLKLKTEAFTLFESVVAITIISICLGIGTLVYSNIVSSEKTLISFESNFEIKALFQNLKKSKLYFPKNFQFDSYDVEQNVTNYQGIEHLYKVSYSVIVGGGKSFTKHFLLYDPES